MLISFLKIDFTIFRRLMENSYILWHINHGGRYFMNSLATHQMKRTVCFYVFVENPHAWAARDRNSRERTRIIAMEKKRENGQNIFFCLPFGTETIYVLYSKPKDRRRARSAYAATTGSDRNTREEIKKRQILLLLFSIIST